MVSGALLLDATREESAAHFYRRRLARIGIPLGFWTLFYTWWSGLDLGRPLTAREALIALLRGCPYYHIYFLFLIGGLYVFTPALRVFMRHSTRPQQALAAAAALLLGSADQLAGYALGPSSGATAFGLFVPFTGYYLAGAVLNNWDVSRAWRRAGPVIFAAAVLGTAGGAGLLWARGWDVALAYGYLSPLVILMALSLFVSVAGPNRHEPVRDKEAADADAIGVFRLIGDAALGTYLIHPALIDLLRVYGINLAHPRSASVIPLAAAVIFLASLMLTLIIQRIPLLKRIVG